VGKGSTELNLDRWLSRCWTDELLVGRAAVWLVDAAAARYARKRCTAANEMRRRRPRAANYLMSAINRLENRASANRELN
jgi:hypothetical protein